MITINEAKRLVKRALLSNIVSGKRDLAITPLISGKHGIGKSQMIKSIAQDLSGVCITVEGGTLKEGEITGLPYQYKDENGNVKFRFLSYYAVDRIQNEERRIFDAQNKNSAQDALAGDENRYALNDLSAAEKVAAIKNGSVKPVIIFIDEINRTENTVYKELMNILLTRSVNGYQFPWWVLFVGAMNPSTQNSVYATNEMDPAQLDRFLKIKVGESSSEWLDYASNAGISSEIYRFIKDNPKMLSSDEKELNDEEKPTPSPRGWDMVDSLLKSEPKVRGFFTDAENNPKIVEKDFKNLIAAKLGSAAATMFWASRVASNNSISPEEIFASDERLDSLSAKLNSLTAAKQAQVCDLMLVYLKDNVEFMMLQPKLFEKAKKQLTALVNKLDSSTRLLFGQKLTSAVSKEGTNLMECFFDVFGEDVLATLDLSDSVREALKGTR